jgi:hypothetical protein
MKRSRAFRLVLVCAALAGCQSRDTQAAPANDQPVASATEAAVDEAKGLDLRLAMRDLWSDHVVWTRDYIIAAVAGTPDADAAAARLMKNQEDIGKAIVPFYGQEAGTKLTDLLKQHITIAVDVVTAAKANDKAKLTDADKRWHDNATEIATFLSQANPNWQQAMLQDMLNNHLALTTQEATARIQKNWTEDVASFDKIYDQAMEMADGLAAGIVKQFPDKT